MISPGSPKLSADLAEARLRPRLRPIAKLGRNSASASCPPSHPIGSSVRGGPPRPVNRHSALDFAAKQSVAGGMQKRRIGDIIAPSRTPPSRNNGPCCWGSRHTDNRAHKSARKLVWLARLAAYSAGAAAAS